MGASQKFSGTGAILIYYPELPEFSSSSSSTLLSSFRINQPFSDRIVSLNGIV